MPLLYSLLAFEAKCRFKFQFIADGSFCTLIAQPTIFFNSRSLEVLISKIFIQSSWVETICIAYGLVCWNSVVLFLKCAWETSYGLSIANIASVGCDGEINSATRRSTVDVSNTLESILCAPHYFFSLWELTFPQKMKVWYFCL